MNIVKAVNPVTYAAEFNIEMGSKQNMTPFGTFDINQIIINIISISISEQNTLLPAEIAAIASVK